MKLWQTMIKTEKLMGPLSGFKIIEIAGWGLSGLMAHATGHEINSLGLAGAFSESRGTNAPL